MDFRVAVQTNDIAKQLVLQNLWFEKLRNTLVYKRCAMPNNTLETAQRHDVVY